MNALAPNILFFFLTTWWTFQSIAWMEHLAQGLVASWFATALANKNPSIIHIYTSMRTYWFLSVCTCTCIHITLKMLAYHGKQCLEMREAQGRIVLKKGHSLLETIFILLIYPPHMQHPNTIWLININTETEPTENFCAQYGTLRVFFCTVSQQRYV